MGGVPPEALLLDGMGEPVDVVQLFRNHLQGLRAIARGESPRLAGRAGISDGRRGRFVTRLRRFVRLGLEARQAVFGKGPRSPRLLAGLHADLPDGLPGRRLLWGASGLRSSATCLLA